MLRMIIRRFWTFMASGLFGSYCTRDMHSNRVCDRGINGFRSPIGFNNPGLNIIQMISGPNGFKIYMYVDSYAA